MRNPEIGILIAPFQRFFRRFLAFRYPPFVIRISVNISSYKIPKYRRSFHPKRKAVQCRKTYYYVQGVRYLRSR